MTISRTRLAARATVAMALLCAIAAAQTMVDLQSQTRNVDFSKASSTRPFTVGSILPPICTTGQTYFRTDAPAGQNLALCTSTNVWTAVESAGGAITAAPGSGITVSTGANGSLIVGTDSTILALQNGNNVHTGNNDFSRAASPKVVVSATKPDASACDTPDEAGRVVLRKSDSATQSSVLYLCQGNGSGGVAWKPSTYAYGSGRPALCDPGEMFFDLTGAAGQQWLGCVAANTWVAVGGGGASLPVQTGNAGQLLGTDGTTTGWRRIMGFVDAGSVLTPDGTVVADLDGNNTWTGHQMYPASSTQVLVSGTDTLICNRRTIAVSATAAVTLSSGATIADGADGQVCVIVNTGPAAITLQDDDARAGSNLQLTGNTIAIPPRGQITLQYSGAAGDWIQDGIASGNATDGNALTAPSGIASGNVLTGGGGTSVVDSGLAAANVVTAASAMASGNVPASNGAKGLTDSGIAAANLVTAAAVIPAGQLAATDGGRRVVASGVAAANVVTAASAIASGNVPASNGAKGLTDSGIAAANLVTAAAVIPAGQLAATDGSRRVVDSGVGAANVVTAASAIASGNVPASNGAKGLTDSGIAAANLVTAAAVIPAGQLAVTDGSRRVVDSGVAAANVVTAASAIASGNVPASNGAKGLTDSGITAANLVTATSTIPAGRLAAANGSRGVIDSGVAADTVVTALNNITAGNVPISDGSKGLADGGIALSQVPRTIRTASGDTVSSTTTAVTLNNSGSGDVLRGVQPNDVVEVTAYFRHTGLTIAPRVTLVLGGSTAMAEHTWTSATDASAVYTWRIMATGAGEQITSNSMQRPNGATIATSAGNDGVQSGTIFNRTAESWSANPVLKIMARTGNVANTDSVSLAHYVITVRKAY